MSAWGTAIDDYIDAIADRLRDIRRHLHTHPELSGQEYQTTLHIAKHLDEAGIPYRIPAGNRGVIVDASGRDDVPRIALRGDIDALPLHDAKDVDYCSMRAGTAHACGHDAHTAIVLGTVLALHACHHRLPWPVPWRAIFQPAEETTQGAREMIEAGAMDAVKYIIAVHVDPERGVGRVGVRYGHLTAACEELLVTIHGEGGHAARPHHTKDSIAIATHFVNAIYQFIPRAVDSRDPVVVSFGMIQGGANANVIPTVVRLQGTIRTMGGQTASCVKERILAIAHGISEASRAQIDVQFKPGADPVINDPYVSSICEEASIAVVGRTGIDRLSLPSMGSEDFSAYLTRAPGCMLRLGSAGGSNSSHFLHSPLFDIDERALTVGVKLLARSAVMLAQPEAVPRAGDS